MTTIECICAHRIEFWYHSKSKLAVPSESEIEHVQAMLNDGYRGGELCMYVGNREFRGWWSIL